MVKGISNALGIIIGARPIRTALLALVILASLILLTSTPQPQDPIEGIIGERQYSLVSWEVGNFFDKWAHKLTSVFGGDGGSNPEALLGVREYFRLNQEIATLADVILRSASQDDDNLASLQEQRRRLERKRNGLRNEVEETIEGQISKALAEEGLSWSIPFLEADGYLFPPVDFRFDDAPGVLAISPRSRIELTSTHLLNPHLGLDGIVELESRVEGVGETSALITGTGGVATYPSIIRQDSSLRHTLRTVAHEWVHHYMIFHSLGLGYWSSADMITINETVADVIGNEIGDAVYRTYYASSAGEPEPIAPDDDQSSDFNRVMRETRLRVDELLAQGQIEEAERFMEERRLYLAEQGVFLRKLNQAYFAFHGSYADRPTSVSPIGDQVRELRRRSPSLKDFVNSASGISSYRELLNLLEE